jgi:hypothetical protein
MIWLGFTWTATEVERRLGLSWGAAQKLIIDACENQEIRSRPCLGDGPDVVDIDFAEWLKAKTEKAVGGKQPRIKALLAKKFSNARVPVPGLCPRQTLIAELLKLDPTLKTIDEDTLKKAIKAYNADPKRS